MIVISMDNKEKVIKAKENWDKMPDFAKQAYLDDPYCEVEVV